MRKRILKNMDWSILICTVLLLAIGLFAIFSANVNSNSDEFRKQIIWILVSIPFMVACIFIDYKTIAK